jgi:aromatic ring-opening dioxygenase catalytic subunit (LigB family)
MRWNPPHEWDKMADWLKHLAGSVGTRPDAIVVISGHWEQPDFSLTSGSHPSLIYDYSGFPPETYEIKYDAPGSPQLAERIQKLLGDAGIRSSSDPNRGFDHGVFIPFKLIYPTADIPIVQLSLKSGLDAKMHLAAGRALEPLREEGILIAGSGMSYHNMRGLMSGGVLPDSDRFDAW